MSDRDTRASLDRQLEERKSQLRKMLHMQYQDPLHIDPSAIPENMDYMWVRDSLRGEPDKTRMTMQKRRGWTPVPAANHPEMIPEFDSGRSHHLDGYIHHSGLILCQRPKEFGDIEKEMEKEANYIAMQNIPGREGSPDVPLKVLKDQTSIQKMQSFKDE